MAYIFLILTFSIWYSFNAGYNVYNAYMKTDLTLPWTASFLQLLVGSVYALTLWFIGFKDSPNLNIYDLFELIPIAILNTIGHACAVAAMFEKGGGSFTHVIKASEPVVSVIFSYFINNIIPKPFTLISLIPVTYGVAYASTLGNLSYNSISRELTSKTAKYYLLFIIYYL